MKPTKKILLCCGLSFFSLDPALAQDATGTTAEEDRSGGLGDIIVTAQRRSESLQEVPIAVTVLTGDEAFARGVTEVSELAGAVPNLYIVQNSNTFSPYLRGVGSLNGNANAELSTAIYVDGVYMGAPNAATVFSLDNIERIEVLKGPQGTLFGRNATAGVIQIITRDPTQDPSMRLKLGYGNYDTVTSSAYVSTGLSPTLVADLALFYENQTKGFGKNVLTGRDINYVENFAARTKWILTPGDTTKITLAADYSQYEAGSPAFQKPPGVRGIDGVTAYVGRYNVRNSLPPITDTEQYGASLKIEQDIADLQFVSISAYRHTDAIFTIDQDTTPIAFVDATIDSPVRTYSQELQLMNTGDQAFDWVVGAFYYHATAADDPIQIAGVLGNVLSGGRGPLARTFGKQRTKSLSGYAQATLDVGANTSVTTGLRFTHERQSINGRLEGLTGLITTYPELRKGFDKWTWRLAIDHDFSDDVHAYASYNRGLKSGGFNLTNPRQSGFNPEILDAYEIGLKSEFLDRRVRLNLAGFYYDYQDITVQVSQAGVNTQVNAGKARIYGLDADLVLAVTDDFRVTGSLGIVNAKYTRYDNAQTFGPTGVAAIIADASGLRTQLTPKITGSLGVDYTVPISTGSLMFNASALHVGNANQTIDGRLQLPAYTLVNGSIGWTSEDERLSVKLWAKNLFDELYLSRLRESALGDFQAVADPRTYGITVSTKF